MYRAITAETKSTTTVRRMTVSRSGQVTFRSSDQDSWAKRTTPPPPVRTCVGGVLAGAATRELVHGGRDSDSQPLVLETSALPAELPAYAAPRERPTADERRNAKTPPRPS